MALALCGCVNLSLTQDHSSFSAQSPTQRAKQLSRINRWQIQGALSLQAEQKTSLANFSWSQKGKSRFNMTISSSLNLYILAIRGQPGKVTLNDGKHKPLTGKSVSALMKKIIGYPLPVSNLYYWIRGLSTPGKGKTQYDSYGHLKQVEQQEWTIRFSHYTRINGVDLPRMLDLKSAHYKIRIVIQKWSF